MSKYKININELEKKGGAEKLHRDGYTREDISKALYRETDGASQRQRQDIMNKLYDKR
jgi:methylmalonyl-CoA mutase N-terminal domain/subunit